MVEIKRVSYAYNSLLDSPFFLDVMVSRDGATLVDIHQAFRTKEEFDEKIQQVVNILSPEDEPEQEAIDDKES